MSQVLVAGLGDLGSAVAEQLAAMGHDVLGLRRSDRPGPPGVRVLQCDLRRPLANPLPDASLAVICLSPSQRTEQDYRQTYVDGTRHLIEAVSVDRVLLVSSSSVWGQDEGQWVTEQDPAIPAGWRGELLLQAESVAADLCPNPVLLRLSGIYGPGRNYLLRQVRSGQPLENPEQWTNRIHRDDAARLICHLLISSSLTGPVIGTDTRPARRAEVLAWLAQRMGVPAPPPGKGSEPDSESGNSLGKRLSNALVLDSGFEFKFPDYPSGYDAQLRADAGAN